MHAITDGDESPASASCDLLRLLVHTIIISEFLCAASGLGRIEDPMEALLPSRFGIIVQVAMMIKNISFEIFQEPCKNILQICTTSHLRPEMNSIIDFLDNRVIFDLRHTIIISEFLCN